MLTLLLVLLPVVALLAGCGEKRFELRNLATPKFGTLASSVEHSPEEARAGVSDASVELYWDRFEKNEGSFDDSYLQSVQDKIDTFRSDGRTVTLDLGLHYPPSWVLQKPDSRFVNDSGDVSDEQNLVFNQRMRDLAEDYLKHATSGIDLGQVAAVRLNSGAFSEILYPGGDHYWAFDKNAQNGPDLPASMSPNPMPGWRPGQAGHSPEEVRAWANWYVGALDNTIEWQIEVLSRLGFRGEYQVLTPGQGVRPQEYEDAIRNNLPAGLLGGGPAWQVFYEQLPRRHDIVAYVSSVGDSPGSNDGCESGDRSIPLDSPDVQQWSSPRWIARIAAEYGFAVSGENGGYGRSASPDLDPAYRDQLDQAYRDLSENGLMADSMRQARTCRFRDFYWAHDQQLWDGTVPFDAYAARIAQPGS
jgi:hypothetical protein